MSKIEMGADGRPEVTYDCLTCQDTGYMQGETKVKKSVQDKNDLRYETVTWCVQCNVGLSACAGFFASKIWPMWEKRPRRSRRRLLDRYVELNPLRGREVKDYVDSLLKDRTRKRNAGNPFSEDS